MLSGLLPLLRESPPYARIRGAVQERRPMWVQGPAGAEKAYLLGALLADPEVAVETTVIVLPGRDAAERLGGGHPHFSPSLPGRPASSPFWEGAQLRRGEGLALDPSLALLAAYGYERLPLVEERGQMAVRGGVIDLFPPAGGPHRIQLFGDEGGARREIDPAPPRGLREARGVARLRG